MRSSTKFGLLMLLMVFTQVPSAVAVTISASFVGGSAPTNTSGAGNLIEIFDAAARVWEQAYQDPFTLHLYFGWDTLDSAGTHASLERSGPLNRETVGIILFDNSDNISFYLDATPFDSEEYQRHSQESQDLGAGFINVARLYRDPVGDAAGHCDLLSVAIHEIGHALGMSLANATFVQETADGLLHISGQYPFAGTVIPLSRNNSGVTAHFDPIQVTYGSVMTGICGDERRMPSALDILAIAQVGGFPFPNLDSLLFFKASPLNTGATNRPSHGGSGGRGAR